MRWMASNTRLSRLKVTSSASASRFRINHHQSYAVQRVRRRGSASATLNFPSCRPALLLAMDSVNITFPCSLLKTASSRIGSLALQSLFALVSFCGSDWFGSTCFNRIDYDGMAYTDVARQVSRGEFHSSINAFRSPLFSWIIALALCSFEIGRA